MFVLLMPTENSTGEPCLIISKRTLSSDKIMRMEHGRIKDDSLVEGCTPLQKDSVGENENMSNNRKKTTKMI